MSFASSYTSTGVLATPAPIAHRNLHDGHSEQEASASADSTGPDVAPPTVLGTDTVARGHSPIDDDDPLFDATTATLASTQSIHEVLRQLQAAERRRAASSQATSGCVSLAQTGRDPFDEETFGPYVNTFGLHTEVGATVSEVDESPTNPRDDSAVSAAGRREAGVGDTAAARLAAHTSPDYPRMTWEDTHTFGPYVSTANLMTDDSFVALPPTTTAAAAAVPESLSSPGVVAPPSMNGPLADEGECSSSLREQAGRLGSGPLNAPLDGDKGGRVTNIHSQSGQGGGSADFIPLFHFRPAEFVPHLVFRGDSDGSDDSVDDYEEEEEQGKQQVAPLSHSGDPDSGPSVVVPLSPPGVPGVQPLEPVNVLTARHRAAMVVPILDVMASTTATPSHSGQPKCEEVEATHEWQASADPVKRESAPPPTLADSEWGDVAVSTVLSMPPSPELGGEKVTGSAPSHTAASANHSEPVGPHQPHHPGSEPGEVANERGGEPQRAGDDDDDSHVQTMPVPKSGKKKKSKSKSVSFSLNDNVVVPPPPPEYALTSEYFYAEPAPEDISPGGDGDAGGGHDGDDDMDDLENELPAVPMMNSPSTSALFGRVPAPRIEGEDGEDDPGGRVHLDPPVRKPRKVYFQSGFATSSETTHTEASLSALPMFGTGAHHPTATGAHNNRNDDVAVDEPVVSLSLPNVAGLVPPPASPQNAAEAALRSGDQRLSLASDKCTDDGDDGGTVAEAAPTVTLSLPAFVVPRNDSMSTASTATTHTRAATDTGFSRRSQAARGKAPMPGADKGLDVLSLSDGESDAQTHESVEGADGTAQGAEGRGDRGRWRHRSPRHAGGETDEEEEESEGGTGSACVTPTNLTTQRGRAALASWRRGSTASTMIGNNASSTYPFLGTGLQPPPPLTVASLTQRPPLSSPTLVPGCASLGLAVHDDEGDLPPLLASARSTPAERVAQLQLLLGQRMPEWARAFQRKEREAASGEVQSSRVGSSPLTDRHDLALSAQSSQSQLVESEDVALRGVMQWPPFTLDREDVLIDPRAWGAFPTAIADDLGRLMEAKHHAHARAYASGQSGAAAAAAVVVVGDATTNPLDESAAPSASRSRQKGLHFDAVTQFLRDASCAGNSLSPTRHTSTAGAEQAAALAQRPFSVAAEASTDVTTSPPRGRSRTALSAVYDVMRALSFTSMQASQGVAAIGHNNNNRNTSNHSGGCGTTHPEGGGFWSWGGTAADVVVQAALEKQLEQQQILLEQSVGLDVLSEPSRRLLSPTGVSPQVGDSHVMTPLENGLMLSDPVMLLPGYAAARTPASGSQSDATQVVAPPPPPTQRERDDEGEAKGVTGDAATTALTQRAEHTSDEKGEEASVPLDQTRNFSEIFGVAQSTPSLRSPALTARQSGGHVSSTRPSGEEEGEGEGSVSLPLSQPSIKPAPGPWTEPAHHGRRFRAVSVGAASGGGGGGGEAAFQALGQPPSLISPLPSPSSSSRAPVSTGMTARPSMSLSTLHALYPVARTAGVGGTTDAVLFAAAPTASGERRRRSLPSVSAGHLTSPLTPFIGASPFSRASLARPSCTFADAAAPSHAGVATHRATSSALPSPAARRSSATAFTAPSQGGAFLSASLSRPRGVSLQQPWQNMLLEQSVSASGVPEDVLTVLQLEEARRAGQRGSVHETLADVLSASQRRPAPSP